MIKFNCPSCGKRLGVPEKFAGSKAKCPKCKGIFRIPAAPQEEELPVAMLDKDIPPSRSLPSPALSSSALDSDTGVTPKAGCIRTPAIRRKRRKALVIIAVMSIVGLAALTLGILALAGVFSAREDNGNGQAGSAGSVAVKKGDSEGEAQRVTEGSGDRSELESVMVAYGSSPDVRLVNALLAAIVLVGSNGDPKAESLGGARGWMQIKEPVWKEVTEKLYGKPLPFDRAFDKETNLEVGKAHLFYVAEEIGYALQVDEYRFPLILIAYHKGINYLWQYDGFWAFPSSDIRYANSVINIMERSLGAEREEVFQALMREVEKWFADREEG